jgi:adenine-specific DNA-methyltransferase
VTEKLKMQTPNVTEQNIEQIAALFPNVMTESQDENGKTKKSIDFDLLKQSLSDVLVEDTDERYRLDWPGKKASLLKANTPITKTLRPCREDSVNFDSTKNVYIEGDNFEVLKILQESYLGKIKMIYIDPPYNTGKDFIYKDTTQLKKADYEEELGATDEDDNKLFKNTDTNGRFHSDWLSMMYERLIVARDLLKDDGVIFISIDENELVNIRKVLDEVFDENSLLFQVTLLCNPKGRSQDKYVANCHEYLLGYSKQELNKGDINIPKGSDEIAKNYKLLDSRGRYRELELRNTHREFGKHNRKNLYYPFYVDDTGNVMLAQSPEFIAIYPNWDDGFEGCWTWGVDKASQQLDEVVAKKVKGKWKIYRKNYAEGDTGEATKQVKSIWTDKQFYTEKGQTVFNQLFDTKDKIFQSPKSLNTIIQLLKMGGDKNFLVLDFFSGSSTTAHAVMQLNAEDNGNRKFIMVQLPEATDEKSEAYKAGYKTIAEIGKERIRRAGQGRKLLMVNEENNSSSSIHNSQLDLDIGFRVYKTDTTNMKEVYYHPEQLKQSDLHDLESNIKEARTPDDLLTQVILDLGLELNLPIEQKTMHGNSVFIVQTNALVACFDDNINMKIIDEIAELKPFKVVFKDASFAASKNRINLEERFKRLSPETRITVL